MSEDTEPVDVILDAKRADMLDWAAHPSIEAGKHSSARLNSDQPPAISIIRTAMNKREQWAKVTLKEEKDKPFNP